MYQQLAPMATTLRVQGYTIGIKGLKQQLEREYGVDMEAIIRRTKEKQAAPKKKGDMSQKEMEKQMASMSALMRTACDPCISSELLENFPRLMPHQTILVRLPNIPQHRPSPLPLFPPDQPNPPSSPSSPSSRNPKRPQWVPRIVPRRFGSFSG